MGAKRSHTARLSWSTELGGLLVWVGVTSGCRGSPWNPLGSPLFGGSPRLLGSLWMSVADRGQCSPRPCPPSGLPFRLR